MKNPSDIFRKFSPNARKILISAQKIAQSMDMPLGSQHLLLALAITPNTLAHGILHENLINLDQIRLVISLNKKTTKKSSGLTFEFKNIIERSGSIALHYNHNQIDSEHILLALLEDSKSFASDIIRRIGSNPEEIKKQIQIFFDDIKSLNNNFSQPQLNKFEKYSSQLPPEYNLYDEIPKSEVSQLTNAPLDTQNNFIDNFTLDLTNEAKNNKIDPVIGRDKEIQRIIQILCRKTKNNPVLVGEPGVGKTAIVEALALRLSKGDVPSQIADKKIVLLDLALLVAGTMYRGQFEDRIKKVIDELVSAHNIILFIDEIHTIVGTGSAEGSLDAANILKPALSKGKIRLIGATTFNEYRKFIEKDPALERRLQKVNVEEPTEEESFEILKGLRPSFEKHHKVKISDEALKSALEFSVRFISDRFLPDKAIDLIDEAAANWQLYHQKRGKTDHSKIENELNNILKKKEEAVNQQNFEKAAMLRTLEIRLNDQLKKISKIDNFNQNQGEEIGRENIARIVSLWTNIPLETLKTDEKEKYLQIEKNLKKFIIGQDEAISQISQSIRRSKTGISDPNRPIGSFIFLGPTGVGKTEIAHALASFLFGSRENIIKIDMSEFMERHNVSRLIGAPPGYVGYDEAGRLTEEIRQKPYSIILFDEIEKAHPEVFNLLLQILEDGQLTDAKGRKVNFKNTIIIMTSNIGIKEFNEQAVIGFKSKLDKTQSQIIDFQILKNQLIDRLKDSLRPEFINRIDKIVVFNPLDQQSLKKITKLQLNELALRLSKEYIFIKYDQKVINLIAKKGFDPKFGARPIRRQISELIEDPLSQAILDSNYSKGDKIQIFVKNDKIHFVKLTNRALKSKIK